MTEKQSTAEKKLEALTQRLVDSRAAVRAQKDKLKIRDHKDHERLALIVGRALLESAKHPDFELMLKGVLKTTIADDSAEFKFLKSKGWL